MSQKKGVFVKPQTLDDDEYLTKVFRNYSVLGVDSKGEPNGKRILTDFTARLVARDVLKKWKGL